MLFKCIISLVLMCHLLGGSLKLEGELEGTPASLPSGFSFFSPFIEKLSSMKLVSGAKNVGDADLESCHRRLLKLQNRRNF